MILDNAEAVYRAGGFAYLDGFAGLVPVKVIDVIQGGRGGLVGKGRLKCKVTENKAGYSRGEIIFGTTSRIVPRKQVIRRKFRYHVLTNYRWER
jgi:hypothetical protein